jgi:type I restriction enzyme S subunit
MKDNKKEKLIPELRFPEFEGEWEKTRLMKITNNISSGKSKRSKKGSFDLYGSMSKIGKTNDLLYRKPTILVARVGANAGQVNLATGEYGVTDNTLIVEPENSINIKFLKELLNKSRLSRLVIGSGRPLVTGGDISKLILKIPSKQEQQKISSFLSLIDKKIELLKKKKELLELYKKGVMQKIFNQEIRFKDEDGNDYPEWEEKRLGEIAKVNKGEQKNRSELREEFEYPVINGGQEPSGFIDTFNTPKNTITISEGGNSCGFVNFITKNFWSGGHCYTLEGLKKSINQYYLYSYLKYNEKKIMRLRVGSGLPNIQEGDIQKFKVVVPSLEEQLDIKKLLKAINKSIEFVSFNLENTKVFKKGLLQKMFI